MAGIDLADYYRETLTLRRLRVLVAGLPAESRFKTLMRARLRESGAPGTAIEDLPPESWTGAEWQLADVRDLLAIVIWMYASTHRGDSKSAPPAPEPVPRPGGVPRRRRAANAWFAGFGLASPEAPTD